MFYIRHATRGQCVSWCNLTKFKSMNTKVTNVLKTAF